MVDRQEAKRFFLIMLVVALFFSCITIIRIQDSDNVDISHKGEAEASLNLDSNITK